MIYGKNSKISAVLFDMDGTLVNTEGQAKVALLEVFAGFGVVLTEEDTAQIVGTTWQSAMESLENRLKSRGLEHALDLSREEHKKRVTKEVLRLYQQKIREELTLVPGAVEAVKFFKNKNLPLALVSGSFRADIEHVLESLKVRDAFQVVFGVEDYGESKPSPKGFLQAARELGVKPEECLVFEDSDAGRLAAERAGMHVCMIVSTRMPPEPPSEKHLASVWDLTEINDAWVLKSGIVL